MAAPLPPQPGDEITADWGQGVSALLGKVIDPKFIQRGTGTISLGGAVSSSTPITFPTPFANAPFVAVTRTTTAGTAPKIHLWAYTASTTGFSCAGATGDSTTSSASIGFSWIAIDPAYLAS